MKKMILCKTYADVLRKAGEQAASFSKNPDKKLFVFCEDKLTMSLEAEIASACGGGTFNCEVVTFNRFIRKKSIDDARKVLDKQSSAMAVKNILLKNADRLNCFKKNNSAPGTALSLFELIAQLKSAKVTPKDILEGANNLQGMLKNKLGDVATVYSLYEDYLKEHRVYDSNSYLELLPSVVEKLCGCGHSAILVAFGSLTKQGVEIVKTIDRAMENLTVILLAGDNTDFYTNEVKTLLLREIDGFSVEESDTVYIEERTALIQKLFDATAFSSKYTETKKVAAYEALNTDEEIRHIAKLIRKEVIAGKRYRDTAIAVGNVESYYNSIERVFSAYEIPFFTDKPEILASHPLSKFIISYVDVLKSGFSPQSVLTLVKNPFFTDKTESDVFENFVLRNAVTKKELKKGLKLSPDNAERFSKEYIIFENLRQKILSLPQNPDTACSLANGVLVLLENYSAETKCKQNAEKLRKTGLFAKAAFTEQAYGKCIKILSDIKEILGETKISAADFKNVLLSGVEATEISVIPQLYDCVYVGNYKDCKYSEHAVLFAAGLNGDVPFSKSDTAILSDKDLTRLEKYDCIVEPKIKIVNKRERENVGAAIISFTEKLYISRAATSYDGKALAKGRTFDQLVRLFSKNGKELTVYNSRSLKEECLSDPKKARAFHSLNFNALRPATEDFLSCFTNLRNGKTDDVIAESSFFSALKELYPQKAAYVENLSLSGGTKIILPLKENGNLIFRRGTISASVLESYFGCPFACFAQNGLRLKERANNNVQANEYGTFIHAALEKYVDILKNDLNRLDKRITDKKSSDELVSEIVSTLTQDYKYSHYLSNDKYKFMFSLIEKEAKRVAWDQYNSLYNSTYRPAFTEARFGDRGVFPAIVLNTKYGEKKVTGYIDRVDRSDNLVRVIDYKTGKTPESDEEFYTGNNIQLFLYMNAVAKGKDLPAGAYYYPVSDKFAKEDEFIYEMKGKTLKTKEAAVASDLSLGTEGGKSLVLGAKITFSNEECDTSKNKCFLPENQFNAYVKYARAISTKGAEEISEGIITPSPYEGKCTWCKYAPVCGYDASNVKTRKEKNVDAQTITEATEEQNGN